MRKVWVVVHRWAGLFIAFFLVVAGLTGSILAFDKEIQDWLNPLPQVAPRQQPMLTPFALQEMALRAAPWGEVGWLSLYQRADQAYVVSITPRESANAAHVHPVDVALDPYTGEILQRSDANHSLWPITRQNFIHLIVELHYSLAIPGNWGMWLFGIVALIWTVDSFIGFYLTLPLMRKEKMEQGAVKSWWLRWQPSWRVRWKSGIFKLNFDLHRAGGLWIWPMLLVLGWSSVGFNLGEQVYRPVMRFVFELPDPYGDLPTLATPRLTPHLGWNEAHDVGLKLLAEESLKQGFRVEREEWMSYDAEKGVYFLAVRSDRDVADEIGATWLLLDGDSGQLAGLRLPTGQNLGASIHSWIFALHMANLWGTPYKIFLALTGILIVVLSVTGVYIWLKKRSARLRFE